MNREPSTSDVTWKDSWCTDDSVERLRGIAEGIGSGNPGLANFFLCCAQWIEDADERITELENLADEAWKHISEAKRILEAK